jgi:uncharacterized SAM-binding protein YcdF (DUF218 family)
MLYQLLSEIVEPFTLTWLLTAIGVVLLWRKPRERLRRVAAVTAVFAAFSIVCTPWFAFLAIGSLEWQYPPLTDELEPAPAIVVLGGGVREADEVRPRPELSEDSLRRCLVAAELHRTHPGRPVVLCGGVIMPSGAGPALALVMRDFLLTQGLPAADLVVEDRSLSTHENAVQSRALLRSRNIDRVLLVTDASHLFRAERCFRRQGFDVIPAGCDYRATRFHGIPADFLPKASAAQLTNRAAHEWIGALWYWLRGRI